MKELSREEASERKLCIKCHESVMCPDGEGPNPALFHSAEGCEVWLISGVCEVCFDNMNGEHNGK